MLCTLFSLLLASSTPLTTLNVSKGDDIADAKAAFATMEQYQATDDARSPGLFDPNCAFKFTFTDGTNSRRIEVPPKAFFESLTQQLALKQGNPDKYEDVQYIYANGFTAEVCGTILYAANGKKEPFKVFYGRDASGVLKIMELDITQFSSAPPQ
jgi:hypothetical protein